MILGPAVLLVEELRHNQLGPAAIDTNTGGGGHLYTNGTTGKPKGALISG